MKRKNVEIADTRNKLLDANTQHVKTLIPLIKNRKGGI